MHQASFDVTINTTMYLRKSYAYSSKLRRRRLSRRRHLFGWLPLANVVKDWAHAYRFYRNYNKALLNQHLTRNSFIAFSLISVTNSLPCLHQNSELLIAGTFTRRVINYFNHFKNPRFLFFASYRNISPSVISFVPKYSPLKDIQEYKFVKPLLDYDMSVTAPLLTDHKEIYHSQTNLLRFLHRNNSSSVKLLYQILVLLTLKRCTNLN